MISATKRVLITGVTASKPFEQALRITFDWYVEHRGKWRS